LKHFAKDLETNLKSENRKGEKKSKKIVKDLGDPIRPSTASSPQPARLKSRKGTPFLSSSNDR
jgi:hypothetical protein